VPELVASQGITLTPVSTDLLVAIDGTLGNFPLTEAYSLQATDAGKTFHCTGTFAITVPDTLPERFFCNVINVGTGIVTFTAGGATVLSPASPKLDNTGTPVNAAMVFRTTGTTVWVLGSEDPDTVTVMYDAGWPAARPYAAHVWAVGHTAAPGWLTAADVWLEAV
jgi:hypothetical protein